MPAQLEMNTFPKTAAQFKAYIALQQNIADWWGADPLVDHTMIINKIEYIRASGNRPAKWLFSGTLQTRECDISQHDDHGRIIYNWVRKPDSVFEKYITLTEANLAMLRQFSK